MKELIELLSQQSEDLETFYDDNENILTGEEKIIINNIHIECQEAIEKLIVQEP